MLFRCEKGGSASGWTLTPTLYKSAVQKTSFFSFIHLFLLTISRKSYKWGMHNNRSRTVRYNKTLITAPPKRKKKKKKEKRQTCKIKTSLTTFNYIYWNSSFLQAPKDSEKGTLLPYASVLRHCCTLRKSCIQWKHKRSADCASFVFCVCFEWGAHQKNFGIVPPPLANCFRRHWAQYTCSRVELEDDVLVAKTESDKVAEARRVVCVVK